MKIRLARALCALTLLASAGCGQTAQTVTLRSLESSGDMSFVCLGYKYVSETEVKYYPRRIDECSHDAALDSDEHQHLYSLVTQQTSGEVALVDLFAGQVVDEEQSVPGFNFLQVGAEPGAIASTPGSIATFVAVGEVGKEGIFALPSSCITPRQDMTAKDLATWPACRLPSAPGDIAILLDTKNTESCRGGTTAEESTSVQQKRDCPADLSEESSDGSGRRVLAVALPDEHGIALIDAQSILNAEPGSYKPCVIDHWVPLRSEIPAQIPEQILPDDLKLSPTEDNHTALLREQPGALNHGPPNPGTPDPGGFAVLEDPTTGEHRLFVADRGLAIIHDIDATDTCRMADDGNPLFPMSFLDPGRTVSTKKVAVSPLTTDGKRYLYAIDEFDGGSVMAFDVSPGKAGNGTPLLHSRSKWTLFEPPDRIKFDAPVEDVAFGLRDRPPADVTTGNGAVGQLCDPTTEDPTLKSLWPASDYSTGASSSNLRGIFAFVALSSGSINFIDVEDFDAKCRRPATTNPQGTQEDFRGCLDPATYPKAPFAAPPAPTPQVTGEASCQVVEPHRSRSAFLVLNDDVRGVHAPSLRARPKLFDKSGRSLSVDQTADGLKHPRMLGVNFAPPTSAEEDPGHAQVYVGTTLFETTSSENRLVIDPTQATENSVVLTVQEPRSYGGDIGYAATYEGVIIAQRNAAQFLYDPAVGPVGGATLVDNSAPFCLGVEDEQAAKVRGGALDVDIGSLDTFGSEHADMVVIKSELVDPTDAYWQHGGAQCGKNLKDASSSGYNQCAAVFGTAASPAIWRELRVKIATPNVLTVESRHATSGSPLSATVDELIQCCFPELVQYEVRVSNEWVVNPFTHNVRFDPASGQCGLDPSVRLSLLGSRVVEVSCDPSSVDATDPKADPTDPKVRAKKGCVRAGQNGALAPTSIGLAITTGDTPDVACVVKHPATDTQTIGESKCIYQGLGPRFVIYRGQAPSERDMTFGWEVRGGFIHLSIPLATRSDPNALPQSMVFQKELGQLVIIDGENKGVVILDMSTFATAQYF